MRIAGMGQPFALDFGAVMQVGIALGADPELLVDVLPAAERAIIAGLTDDGSSEE